MNKIKMSIMTSVVLLGSTLIFSACGSSDDTTTTTTTTQTAQERDITVVDAYVIGATVTDGTVSSFTNAQGVATAAYDANSIIRSTGGTIDANGNGVADDNESAALPMAAPAGKDVVSPLTNLIVLGAAEDKLAELLGVSVEELYTDPIATNNVELAKAMQVVVAVSASDQVDAFIQDVNSYVAPVEEPTTTTPDATTATDGDLPSIGQYDETTTVTTEENTTEETNTTTTEGDLPVIQYNSREGDLPSIGQYETTTTTVETTEETATTTTTQESNTTTTTQTTTTASVEAMIALAKKLFAEDSAEAALLDAIANADVTNAAELEAAIFEAKKAVLETATVTQTETTEAVATEAADAEAEAQESATEMTDEVTDATQTETTEETTADTNTTETTESETTEETTETETTTTDSDLPTFSY